MNEFVFKAETKREEKIAFSWSLLITVFFVITFIMAFEVGEKAIKKQQQIKAVNRGLAEFYVDLNYERQFRWKTQSEIVKEFELPDK